MNINELKKIILARLNLFSKGSLPLYQLVGDLKAFQDSISSSSPLVTADFDKLRFSLEEINALRLDEEYSGNDEYEEFLKSTVEKLNKLVQSL